MLKRAHVDLRMEMVGICSIGISFHVYFDSRIRLSRIRLVCILFIVSVGGNVMLI